MKALILNGAERLRDMAEATEAALRPELAARGHDIVRHDLTALTVPDCNGDFGCWTVTPGICVQAGPHREVARDLIQSDLAVWLTPVTFGGYSSALKRHLDHCIPLISALFAKVEGETHHEPRYDRFPSLLVVGLQDQPAATAAQVFERIVQRNVLNMYAPHFASPILTRAELPGLAGEVRRWLDDVATSVRPHVEAEPLDLGVQAGLPLAAPRRVLLLVGSPRGQASVSASLVDHLASLLTTRGLAVATESIHKSLRADPGLHRLGTALAGVDVVGLASPLYVDGLPGPVTAALEVLGRRQAAVGPRPRFFALVNSGFPEAVHNDTALAICRLFAEQAGLEWIGGLAIGGGGMLAGKPLAELGPQGRVVVQALLLTAEAIAEGRPVPDTAQRLVRRLPIPTWLYRFLAGWGFRQEAKKRGTLSRLGDRPYAA